MATPHLRSILGPDPDCHFPSHPSEWWSEPYLPEYNVRTIWGLLGDVGMNRIYPFPFECLWTRNRPVAGSRIGCPEIASMASRMLDAACGVNRELNLSRFDCYPCGNYGTCAGRSAGSPYLTLSCDCDCGKELDNVRPGFDAVVSVKAETAEIAMFRMADFVNRKTGMMPIWTSLDPVISAGQLQDDVVSWLCGFSDTCTR